MGRIRIGNSGWSYQDWVGPFYPDKTHQRNFLGYYLSRFDTVEINSTFYSTPSMSTVKGWVRQASALGDREFTVKVPSRISHELCMEDDPADLYRAMDDFDER